MEIQYVLNKDNTATVTKIPDPAAVIRIPGAIDGHLVTALGSDIIPRGVKSRPREIHLPDTLCSIGSHALDDLRYLSKLTLPEGLAEIGDFGIFTCPDLTELYVPASVRVFGRCAFGYMYEHGRAYPLHYFTLLCEPDSPAREFAQKNQISWKE